MAVPSSRTVVVRDAAERSDERRDDVAGFHGERGLPVIAAPPTPMRSGLASQPGIGGMLPPARRRRGRSLNARLTEWTGHTCDDAGGNGRCLLRCGASPTRPRLGPVTVKDEMTTRICSSRSNWVEGAVPTRERRRECNRCGQRLARWLTRVTVGTGACGRRLQRIGGGRHEFGDRAGHLHGERMQPPPRGWSR